MDRVTAFLGEKPHSMGALRERAREAEAAESRALQDHLRSRWYHQGRESILSSPPRLRSADYRRSPRQLRDALPPLVFHRLSLVDSLHRALRPGAEADYHELRKLMKKLRYILEFFELVLGEPGRRLHSAAVDVQNPLGVMQDSVVARTICGELAVADSALEEGLSALAAAQEEAVADAWGRFCDPWLRQDVCEELMQL
jgi:CHAD domain-containing protein